MNEFNFDEWKIKLDMANRHAIVRCAYVELFDKIYEKFPALNDLVLDNLYDGTFVLINTDKIDSLKPFIYKGVEYPFTFIPSEPNQSGWSLWWGNELFLYDGVEFMGGKFSSAERLREVPNNRQLLLDCIKKCEENIEIMRKTATSQKGWESSYRQDQIEDNLDSLAKLKRFLQESNKELVYDEKTKMFVKALPSDAS